MTGSAPALGDRVAYVIIKGAKGMPWAFIMGQSYLNVIL